MSSPMRHNCNDAPGSPKRGRQSNSFYMSSNNNFEAGVVHFHSSPEKENMFFEQNVPLYEPDLNETTSDLRIKNNLASFLEKPLPKLSKWLPYGHCSSQTTSYNSLTTMGKFDLNLKNAISEMEIDGHANVQASSIPENADERISDKEVNDNPLANEITSSGSDAKSGQDMHLVLDTALLKDFLDRAALSKEKKKKDIAKRSSVSHRRDSDAVRNALGSSSPIKTLGERYPSSPLQQNDNKNRSSPDKAAGSSVGNSKAFNDAISSVPVFSANADVSIMSGLADERKGSRRSNRVRSNRAPQSVFQTLSCPTSQKLTHEGATTKTKLGRGKTVTRKTEAQELVILTRKNSNKNKRGALPVWLRLADLAQEDGIFPDADTSDQGQVMTQKRDKPKLVTWAENLVEHSSGSDKVCIVLKKGSYSTIKTSTKKPRNKSTFTKAPAANNIDGSRSKNYDCKRFQAKYKNSTTTSIAVATPEKRSGPTHRTRSLETEKCTPAKSLLASSILPAKGSHDRESATFEMTRINEQRQLATPRKKKQH